jgi:hypothetical protein
MSLRNRPKSEADVDGKKPKKEQLKRCFVLVVVERSYRLNFTGKEPTLFEALLSPIEAVNGTDKKRVD